MALAALLTRRPRAPAVLRRPAGIALLLAALALTVIGSFAAARAMELDYFRIPLELGQLALLAASFLVLAAPFVIAGLISALAYADPGIPAARVYVAAMAGSGLGAAAPVGLLPAFGIAGAVAAVAAVPAFLGVLTAAAARSGSGGRPGRAWPRGGGGWPVSRTCAFVYGYNLITYTGCVQSVVDMPRRSAAGG